MRILLAALLCCLSGLPAQAQALKVVTENFAPYNYEEGGIPKGLSTEVVQAALEAAGIEAQIEFYPWARSYLLAQTQKNTLIYSIARIPEREHLFKWVGHIAPYRTSLFKLSGRDDVSVTALEDAKAYSVGVTINDVSYQYLMGQGFPNVVVAETDLLNVRKLALARLDLAAFDEAQLLENMRLEAMTTDLFTMVHRIEALSGHLYMALQKDSDPDLLHRIRKGLEAIKSNGTYARILDRYQMAP
ncbi:hypothetical protein GCM10011316_33860 [Roseibium aquae]|uniref:Solute-binding protein family 3/N-terminal domain-containing protein n=1 Tax=Roseibium aquae TaxID=1323746 RepID=A0A916X236_9HYPH|nr:transporter substrate-binding domain-containing protein [Roseibium aquae]GGB59039.1 hypothetical protein GCM10011316_33860 [Roseibium aquae]